ncbi:MAG TPA: hypothetical protein VGL60_13305 [Acidimicrobiales bacterium]
MADLPDTAPVPIVGAVSAGSPLSGAVSVGGTPVGAVTVQPSSTGPRDPVRGPAAGRRRARVRRDPRARVLRRARRRLLLAALLLVAVLGGSAAYNLRSSAAQRADVVALTLPPIQVPGTPPVVPWPSVGEAAIAVPAVGLADQSGIEQAVPVASLTKLMTAWVVLRDHPLRRGQDGPTVTMSALDVAEVREDDRTDQANIPVAEGEQLTERQLLEGLVVHSADNLADALARWDAGSITAFVAKMNSAAAALGMHQTHYVDADGFDSGSRSTAADVLMVASRLMSDPAFATIAAMRSVTLPVGGTEDSYTPLLGTQGVIGVKSGFTSQAGGCDVLALSERVGTRSVLVLAAVTGQAGSSPLAQAGAAALADARAASGTVHEVSAVTAGEDLARASLLGRSVAAVATRSVSVLGTAGARVRVVLHFDQAPAEGAARGTEVAVATVGTGRDDRTPSSTPVRLSGALPARSLVDRLLGVG